MTADEPFGQQNMYVYIKMTPDEIMAMNMFENVPDSSYAAHYIPEEFLEFIELRLTQQNIFLTPYERNQALGAMWRIRLADLENMPVQYRTYRHQDKLDRARAAVLLYPFHQQIPYNSLQNGTDSLTDNADIMNETFYPNIFTIKQRERRLKKCLGYIIKNF